MRELQEQSERVRQLMTEPDAVRQMRELQEQSERVRQLMSPSGRDVLTSHLQALTQPEFIAQLDLGLEAGQAEVGLRSLGDAASAWIATAQLEPLAPSSELPATDFGWVELLPTLAQLNLLPSTMDVLNGLFLLVSYLAPGSAPPMALLLMIEALLRLARFLFARVDSQ
jgi:hypothetical protein